MHSLSLVVFLTLAAAPPSSRAIPAGCREDHETCREDCTIDYGGRTTKYRQLGECLQRCEKEQKECTSQHYLLQDAQIELLPAREPDPAMREPETHDAPARDSTVPASSTEPPSAEPAEAKEPAAAPSKSAPEPASAGSEDHPISDEPEPAPAPKPDPKPAASQHPLPPPEPKKKDISDWDPNGD